MNKGVGSIYGYYALSQADVNRIKEKPRNTSLTFDAIHYGGSPLTELQEYKTFTFLVKSSSRFFLKPDIGEIIDQIEFEDYHFGGIKAICMNDQHEMLKGTEGEHFLMTATLLK